MMAVSFANDDIIDLTSDVELDSSAPDELFYLNPDDKILAPSAKVIRNQKFPLSKFGNIQSIKNDIVPPPIHVLREEVVVTTNVPEIHNQVVVEGNKILEEKKTESLIIDNVNVSTENTKWKFQSAKSDTIESVVSGLNKINCNNQFKVTNLNNSKLNKTIVKSSNVMNEKNSNNTKRVIQTSSGSNQNAEKSITSIPEISKIATTVASLVQEKQEQKMFVIYPVQQALNGQPKSVLAVILTDANVISSIEKQTENVSENQNVANKTIPPILQNIVHSQNQNIQLKEILNKMTDGKVLKHQSGEVILPILTSQVIQNFNGHNIVKKAQNLDIQNQMKNAKIAENQIENSVSHNQVPSLIPLPSLTIRNQSNDNITIIHNEVINGKVALPLRKLDYQYHPNQTILSKQSKQPVIQNQMNNSKGKTQPANLVVQSDLAPKSISQNHVTNGKVVIPEANLVIQNQCNRTLSKPIIQNQLNSRKVSVSQDLINQNSPRSLLKQIGNPQILDNKKNSKKSESLVIEKDLINTTEQSIVYESDLENVIYLVEPSSHYIVENAMETGEELDKSCEQNTVNNKDVIQHPSDLIIQNQKLNDLTKNLKTNNNFVNLVDLTTDTQPIDQPRKSKVEKFSPNILKNQNKRLLTKKQLPNVIPVDIYQILNRGRPPLPERCCERPLEQWNQLLFKGFPRFSSTNCVEQMNKVTKEYENAIEKLQQRVNSNFVECITVEDDDVYLDEEFEMTEIGRIEDLNDGNDLVDPSIQVVLAQVNEKMAHLQQDQVTAQTIEALSLIKKGLKMIQSVYAKPNGRCQKRKGSTKLEKTIDLKKKKKEEPANQRRKRAVSTKPAMEKKNARKKTEQKAHHDDGGDELMVLKKVLVIKNIGERRRGKGRRRKCQS